MAFATLLMLEESAPPLIDVDGTVLIQFGLFLIMFFALSRLLFKPYLRVREARDAGITGARAEAKTAEERAHKIVGDYEQQLTRAKQRGADERTKLRADGAKRENDLLNAARTESQNAIGAAKTRIQTEATQAGAQLEREAGVLAKQMAAKIVGREIAS